MTTKTIKGFLGAAMVVMGLAGLVAAAGTEDGLTVHQLSDLADGESRTFGEGAHAIRATRHGNEVSLELPGHDGEAARTIVCALDSDRCTVMTSSGDDAKTMVMVKKTSGEGEMTEHEVELLAGGTDAPVWVAAAGAGGEGTEVRMLEPGDAGTILRCPEGDTTMTLGKDEANAGYRCPKHGVELKPVEGKRMIRKVVVINDGEKKEVK